MTTTEIYRTNSINKEGEYAIMGKYINLGNAGFQAMKKGLYVDKTGMINYINSTLGSADKLTCVSRPRRFGKSFAAKMLCAYYDKSCDSRDLFQGLEISKNPCFEVYLNKYDVYNEPIN